MKYNNILLPALNCCEALWRGGIYLHKVNQTHTQVLNSSQGCLKRHSNASVQGFGDDKKRSVVFDIDEGYIKTLRIIAKDGLDHQKKQGNFVFGVCA